MIYIDLTAYVIRSLFVLPFPSISLFFAELLASQELLQSVLVRSSQVEECCHAPWQQGLRFRVETTSKTS